MTWPWIPFPCHKISLVYKQLGWQHLFSAKDDSSMVCGGDFQSLIWESHNTEMASTKIRAWFDRFPLQVAHVGSTNSTINIQLRISALVAWWAAKWSIRMLSNFFYLFTDQFRWFGFPAGHHNPWDILMGSEHLCLSNLTPDEKCPWCMSLPTSCTPGIKYS